MSKLSQMEVRIHEVVDTETHEMTFEYEMWDGPDGIDDSKGIAKTLGECFEMIMKDRVLTGLSYQESTS